VIAALAVGFSITGVHSTQAQVAPRENTSRIIHRFPPLPDIVQRKADVDARRMRTGIITKMLVPRPKGTPHLEIDLDQSMKRFDKSAVAKPTIETPPPTTTTGQATPPKTEPTIIQTSHQEADNTSDTPAPDVDHLPMLPEVEPAAEPVLPKPAAPSLRNDEDHTASPNTPDHSSDGPALPPPKLSTTTKSMQAPSMRRDRKKDEATSTPTPKVGSVDSLPRTLPEMNAPPIREAISPEEALKAKAELEEKLRAIAGKHEMKVPSEPPAAVPTKVELNLPAAPSVPVKMETGADIKQGSVKETPSRERPVSLPPQPAKDELSQARNELHQLARPIPVSDPSLELAAEELKQLAGTIPEKEPSFVMPTSNPSPPPSAGPGLRFARDNIGKQLPPPTKLPEEPKPAPPEKKPEPAPELKTPAPSPTPATTLKPGPQIALPPVNLDALLPKKELAPEKPKTEPATPAPKPELPKKSTSTSNTEPALKPIPPAAAVTPASVPVASTAAPVPPAKDSNPSEKPTIPRLRREASVGHNSPPPSPVKPMEKPVAQATEKPLALPSPAPEIALLPIPQPKPKPEPTTSKSTPSSWRPAMPAARKADSPLSPEPSKPEIIQTASQPASKDKPTSPEVRAHLTLPETTPSDVASDKPRMLAPIESDELGTTSTRSILMPNGEKPVRSDFSRSMAARSIDTLKNSKARTAREQALADLARMDEWHKAEGATEAIKLVAMADDRLLMRQAAVEVLAAVPASEKAIDWVLQDIAASNSAASIRQLARDLLKNRQ
jgi:hypothetical protein